MSIIYMHPSSLSIHLLCVSTPLSIYLSLSFYLPRLFEIRPNLYKLFAFGDEGFSEDNEKLRKHALDVMTTVDAAIGMVVDGELATLVDTLIELGMVHHMKSVTPKEFEVRL